MIQPTIYSWILAIFGAITFLPLLAAQWLMLIKPKAQITKDLIIGKGQDWRDHTHYKSAKAFAWADWLVILPLLIIGSIGALSGHPWGYILWMILGVLSIYFSIIFWVLEKEYTYKSAGKLAYFTYFWGFFLYWGIAAVIYSYFQLI